MKSSSDEDQGVSFWPAVADVFIGFLALILVALLVAYLNVAESRGETPPPEKESFKTLFEKTFAEGMTEDGISIAEQPRVEDAGFSELKIYFPASFLFQKCEVELMRPAEDELGQLRSLFRQYRPAIHRVEITGHTDSDQPSKTDGRCAEQGIRSNWELSARRAITVVQQLAPDDGSGLEPTKVWAAALGQYHPVDDGVSEEAKARNRRIEILVKFKEHRNTGELQ